MNVFVYAYIPSMRKPEAERYEFEVKQEASKNLLSCCWGRDPGPCQKVILSLSYISIPDRQDDF